MGITVRLRITGANEILAAFRKLPKEATKALRDANQEIAKDLAGKIREAAVASSPQSAAVAPSIKAYRDRKAVPAVSAGGGRLATHQRRRSRGQEKTTAGQLVFGANFGANYLKQFRKHTGAGEDDYWFFRTVEDNEPRIVKEWGDAADRILKEWGEGG